MKIKRLSMQAVTFALGFGAITGASAETTTIDLVVAYSQAASDWAEENYQPCSSNPEEWDVACQPGQPTIGGSTKIEQLINKAV